MPLCADDLPNFCEVRKLAYDGTLLFGTGVDTTGFTSGVATMTTAATAAAATITAGLSAAAIKVGSDFEASMSQVAATMGISSASEDFAMLSAAAKEMGESTKFSAAQASSALNFLALSGKSAEESVAALPTVLNVAAAGGMELASASDMITDAMSALGLETSQMSTFADQLAVTSQKSNTSVSQLGEAILTVGGTAKTLSGGVTEMNTALGILADNGIKGSEGGTMLRNVILSLSAPTDTAAAALKKLGVEAFDKVTGSMRPLQETFADLGGALSQLTEQERTEALSNIFNKVDLKGVNALLGTSAERFDELSGYISDCSGAAAQMAATMDDNLKGDLTIMQSALEGLGIAAYEKFQEPMRTAVQEVTNSIGDLSKSITSGRLGESLERLAVSFGNFVASAGELVSDKILPAAVNGMAWLAENSQTLLEVAVPLVASVTAFNAAMKGFTMWQTAATAIQTLKTANEGATIAQIALNTAMEANPVGLLVAGVAALTAGLIAFASVGSDATAKTDEYAKSLERARENADGIIASSDKEIALLQVKAERYEKLRENYANLTDGEMAEFLDLANELQGILPEGTKIIDEQTGAYNSLEAAIDGVIQKMRTQALLNAKNAEYETAIANIYDYEKKMEAAKSAWENDAGGKAMIDDWRYNASRYYDDISDEAAQKAFITEYFRTEYGIDYDELQGILAENQAVVDDFEKLYRQQYEDMANDTSQIDGEYKSTQQLEGEERARNYKEMAETNARQIAETQAENTALLKSAWEQAEHEYATGVIASEEALYARKSALLSQYGNADLKEHWQYYEELYGYRQDYSEKSQKEAKEAAEAAKKAAENAVAEELAIRQSEWENIDRLNTLGLMSDEDAAKARAEFVKKYYGDVDLTTGKGITKENFKYVQKIREDNLDATKKSLDEQEKLVDKGLSDIVDRHKKAYDELEKKRQSYRDKLMAVGGDLFSVEEIEKPDGTKVKQYTVNDLDEQLRKMREYNSAVKKLRAQGMSDGMLAEMTSLNPGDSIQFAKYLSGMSAEEFAKINELYNEKQKLADELSNDLYKSEAQKISDNMTAELGNLAASAYDYGAQTAQQFSAGFNEAMRELDISALYGQVQAGGANKNYENYKTGGDGSAQNLKISVDVSGKNSIYLDGKKIGEFNIKYQGEDVRQKGA